MDTNIKTNKLTSLKSLLLVATVALGSALAAVGIYKWVSPNDSSHLGESQTMRFANVADMSDGGNGNDFTVAAARSTPAVVHIKVKIEEQPSARGTYDPFGGFFGGRGLDDFFGPQQRGPGIASGSGVIISADGYIATNNHVVADASKIEVILNDRRSYIAKVIGKDPNTDLALLKIEEKNLPFLSYGNSDNVKVGEWVLAVGNPFNLTSTVTAGIVSAKGRSIGIIGEDQETGEQSTTARFPIESFIQTDAAVNPGNSGGALVNTRGELVGINTAIASQTGSYAGYSFAVPVNLVQKVMKDLLEFGTVQRAFLGVGIQDVTAALAEEKGIDQVKGVYVNSVNEGAAAGSAGVKIGDVITKVGDVDVNSVPELQEQIGRHRPGDKITLAVNRDDKEKVLPVTLQNKDKTTEMVKKEAVKAFDALGANFGKLSDKEKKDLKLQSGVKVENIKSGKLASVGVRNGFVITKLDKKAVNNEEEVSDVLGNNTSGMLMVEGIYPNNPYSTYVFSFGLK